MRRALLWVATLFGWGSSFGAHAQVALPLTELGPGAIRIDGSIREWLGVRFLEVGEGSDGSMRIALGYDRDGLFIAAEVRDERLIRTSSPGRDEDAIILTLALPRGRHRYEGRDIYLWAGESGRIAASAGIAEVGGRPTRLPAAQVVEAPQIGGYTLEAFIPWSAIPGAARWQEGRATIRLRDVDSAAHPEVEREPSVAPVEPAHLERLPALAPNTGEAAALQAFLATQSLEGALPSYELHGNVGEDPRPERISIVDRFVVVTGPGWRSGRGYSFLRLPIATAADVRAPRLVDLTGDDLCELVCTVRQSDARGARELWLVIGFGGGEPAPMFAIETLREIAGGRIEARVRIGRGRRGRPPTIEHEVGGARGLDAATYREAEAGDAEPILTPWGPVRARRYRWDGHGFVRVEEVANPAYVDPDASASLTTARATATFQTGAASSQSTGASTVSSPASVPSPPVSPSLDEVLAEFRRQRGLRTDTQPRWRYRANVAFGDEPEEVVVDGRDLVIFGPGVRDGTGWFHYEIPVRDAGDVLEVRTAEVTGDRCEEILLRIRRSVGDVRREVLLVYQMTTSGFTAILQREVAREQGGNRIDNEVRVGRGQLEIRPGTARGWSVDNWPWSDVASSDGIEPLLLPWRDGPVRYRFVAGRLVR